MSGLRHGRAPVNGTELHFVDVGNGPVLLLLHGWPVTWRHWRRLIPILVSNGWRVIAPDLRGLGESARSEDGYSTPVLAEDIGQLASTLGIAQCAVMGHDWGGSVAYALAVKYPSLVTRLVVEEELIPGFRVELPSEGARRYPTWHGPFHAARGVPELLIPGNEREYLGLFWDLTFEPGSMDAADVEEYLRAYTERETLRCWLAYYREAATDAAWNRRAATKSLSVPVLTLGGHEAMGAAVGASLRHVALDVRHVTLARCGHYPSYERPLDVAQHVTAFLESASSPGH